MIGWRGTLILLGLLVVAATVAWIAFRDQWPWDSEPTQAPFAETDGVIGVFVLPEDGREPILTEIDAARTSITLQIYLLGDEAIITALENAVQRGVQVQVLLEEHPFGGAGTEEAIYEQLEQGGIEVRWGDPVFRFSHVKTFVIDDHVAIVMNQNLTRSSFEANREFFAITTRPAEVRQAAEIFDADWNRTGAEIAGPLVVSPTNSRNTIIELIASATESLDIYAEVVRDQEIIAALIAAEVRGVAVRMIVSPDSSSNDRGQAERAQLAAAGAEIRLATGNYIHAKLVLADGTRMYLGSQNFTATSLDQNREIGLMVDDPNGVARVERVFAGDFASGRPEV